MRSVPIWVHFPNLKLHYYTEAGLSKFASYIGKSLFTDKQTANQARVSYARVCIEFYVDSSRPRSIPYENEFGQMEQQDVEYEWLPPSCGHCKRFGHALKHCPQMPKPCWVPKVTLAKANTNNDAEIKVDLEAKEHKKNYSPGGEMFGIAISLAEDVLMEEEIRGNTQRSLACPDYDSNELADNKDKGKSPWQLNMETRNSYSLLELAELEKVAENKRYGNKNEVLGRGAKKKLGKKIFSLGVK